MRLFHYTCGHARTKITKDYTLRPNEHSYGGLLWLTDMAVPDVLGLGLSAFMLRCDRTEFRVTVDTDLAVPWTTWAHDHHVPLPIRLALDGNMGAMPKRWWVSQAEIPILAIEPTFAKRKASINAH